MRYSNLKILVHGSWFIVHWVYRITVRNAIDKIVDTLDYGKDYREKLGLLK